MLLANIKKFLAYSPYKTIFFSLMLKLIDLSATEKTLMVENATQFQIDTLQNQPIHVKSLSIKNLSDNDLENFILTVNNTHEKKCEESINYLNEFGLSNWLKKYGIVQAHNHLYDYASGFKIELPLRNVPGFSKNFKEYYFQNQWHLISTENNNAFFSYDNKTATSFDDAADDPFLILRTKTSNNTKSFTINDSALSFASLDIFPSDYSCCNPKDKNILFPLESIFINIAPGGKIKFFEDGLLEQHILLKNDKYAYITSIHPIDYLKNESYYPIYLNDEEIVLKPSETYFFTTSQRTISIKAEGENGKIILCSNNVKFPNISNLNDIIHFNKLCVTNFEIEIEYENKKKTSVQVDTSKNHFDHELVFFKLSSEKNPEKIHWQIAKDPSFEFVLSNFDEIRDYSETINLDLLSDTFLNNDTTYYFRLKSLEESRWSEWTSPFSFTVSKPEPVENVVFSKVDQEYFRISWDKQISENVQYLVFASNDLDFIPEIYNLSNSNESSILSISHNLIAKTADCSLKIGTDYAFYRIVAENKNHYSLPSPIIRVYDRCLKIERSVLQTKIIDEEIKIVRTSFPVAYPEINEVSYDIEEKSNRGGISILNKKYYIPNPYVDATNWNRLEPLLLPENHPEKLKLDRLFSTRVTQSQSTLKKAGFTNPKPMKYSKTIVTRHVNFPGYIFKFYNDEQKINDIEKCARRVIGSILIQESIDKHQVNHLFVVPKKYLYPIPTEPSPKSGSHRKNYIVFENEMDIYIDKPNTKMWKSDAINKTNLFWLFIIMQEMGLSDSPFPFNIPLTKDKRIAFIDTEHFHKWPVPFFKLEVSLTSEMKSYWKSFYKKNK